eukprot:9545019-Karenia_brevis.AAC.1
MSGIPSRVLVPYMNYHENSIAYFVFSGAFGKGHRFPCGIPQGCPLSMVFIALMMRPWTLQMREMHATPRALADDVLLTAIGDF